VWQGGHARAGEREKGGVHCTPRLCGVPCRVPPSAVGLGARRPSSRCLGLDTVQPWVSIRLCNLSLLSFWRRTLSPSNEAMAAGYHKRDTCPHAVQE
jgi:hypothetical protein